MTSSLKLGTRGSPLALWQAHHVADLIRPVIEPRTVEIVTIQTHGDRDQSSALSAMGGFGVFTRAIQDAILDGRADVAVHSLKDLPTIPVEGIMLAATPERAPTGDAFLSSKYKRFDDLPKGAIIGTSSLRRRAQITNHRPDLKLIELRGNVDTRIRKLDEQNLDGIILAEAGLVRLGLKDRITEILNPEWMLPAVGQGAIGLECRTDDSATREILSTINHFETWSSALAERSMLATLGGGCLVPIGARSSIANGLLTLRGSVLTEDGRRRIAATFRGSWETPLAVGQVLAAMLVDEGANELLNAN